MARKALTVLDLTAIQTGTAPMLVTSVTVVTNFNADLLDGQHGSYYQNAGNLNAGTILAARMPAHTGDVTSSAGSVALTIANNAVNNAKAADMATQTIKGRTTAGTGDPEDLTPAQARAVLQLGTMALEPTANFVDGGNDQTIGGTKTFSQAIVPISVSTRTANSAWGLAVNNSAGTTAGGVWHDSSSGIRFINAAFNAGIELTSSLTTIYGNVQIQSTNELRFFNTGYYIKASTGFEFNASDFHRWLVAGNERMRLTDTILSGSAALNISDAIRSTNDSNGVGYTGAGIEMYFNPASDDGFIISYDRTAALWKTLRVYGDTIDFYPGGSLLAKVTTNGFEDNAGNVRDIPQNIQNATYTFVLADRGKHVIKTNTTAYTWTIPPNSSVAYPIGTAITIIHDSTAGNITIARGSGVALLNGTTDANFTLSAGQARTLLKVGTDRWRVL